MDAPGSGQGGHPHRPCSSAEQGLRSCPGGGAGGEDIVNEQNVPASNSVPVCNLKGASEVDAAGVRREASLTFSGALTEQGLGGQGELPLRVRFTKPLKRVFCQCPSLIEAALGLFGAMEGYGNHEHFCRSVLRELRDRLGKHASQAARGRVQPVVFQCVDGGFHAPLI